LAAAVIAAEAAGAVPDGVVAIEVAPDQHPQAGTGAPAGLLFELQGDVVRGDENIWVNARVRIVKKMRFVRTQRKPTTDATSTAHALPDTG
jgi:hypothetical protein